MIKGLMGHVWGLSLPCRQWAPGTGSGKIITTQDLEDAMEKEQKKWSLSRGGWGGRGGTTTASLERDLQQGQEGL